MNINRWRWESFMHIPSNMLELLLDLLWSKTLSAPSIYVRVWRTLTLKPKLIVYAALDEQNMDLLDYLIHTFARDQGCTIHFTLLNKLLTNRFRLKESLVKKLESLVCTNIGPNFIKCTVRFTSINPKYWSNLIFDGPPLPKNWLF